MMALIATTFLKSHETIPNPKLSQKVFKVCSNRALQDNLGLVYAQENRINLFVWIGAIAS